MKSKRICTSGCWWLKSDSFKLFAEDHFAQGYEILRRRERFRLENFFQTHGRASWSRLTIAQRSLFRTLYSPVLERMGLTRRIFFSRNCIIFDCRLTPYYLIKALEQELMRLGVTVKGYNEQAAICRVYTKRGRWQAIRGSYRIRLDLPTAKNGDQILSLFANFVRDRPSVEFESHRRKFPSLKAVRNPFNSPTTLALALMIHDHQDVLHLGRWLWRRGKGDSDSFVLVEKRDGRMKDYVKAIRNAKQQLRAVILAEKTRERWSRFWLADAPPLFGSAISSPRHQLF